MKRDDAYQDSVTAPLDRSFDDDAAGLDEEGDDEDEDNPPSTSPLQEVLTAVEKVSNLMWILRVTSHTLISHNLASQGHTCSSIKPSATPGLVSRGQNIIGSNGKCFAFNGSHAHHFGCQDSLVIYASDAS